MSKKAITLFIILSAIIAVFAAKFFVTSLSKDTNRGALAKAKGPLDAPIQITEFIDFQCPPCAYGAGYLNKFMQEQPGIIRLEIKYFPLKMHKHAILAASYAECAARDEKFWPFYDYLFKRQKDWKDLNDAGPEFERFAKEAGINIGELKSCLKDKTINEIIQKNLKEGKALGVKSTPTYFVNGKMTVGIKSLKTQLNRLLDETKN